MRVRKGRSDNMTSRRGAFLEWHDCMTLIGKFFTGDSATKLLIEDSISLSSAAYGKHQLKNIVLQNGFGKHIHPWLS